VLLQARVDGDGAIDLAAAPEQAAERELDLGRIPVRAMRAKISAAWSKRSLMRWSRPS
jgi:hypothetical protein